MNVDKIPFYLHSGKRDKYWYRDTENLFVEIFGREKLSLVAKLFAATSINSSLPSNITLFRRALHEMENDLPFSNYLPGIKRQLEQIKSGRGLTGMKINSFAAAMQGDIDAVVVDVWLLRAFDLDKKYFRKGSATFRSGGASPKNFLVVQNYLRHIAYTLDLEPRQVSAMVWSGIRSTVGRNKITRYHEILKFKLYNMYENSSNK